MRIALVEDNESLAKGIAYRFKDAGHAVDVLHNGDDADAFLCGDGNDVIILDVNLPGLDGLSLLKNLRERGDGRPVILLTARSETEQRVLGLDAGADDYLVKPFDMAELEARVRALSRRKPQTLRRCVTLGELTLDLAARQVSAGDAVLEIPRRELSVLEALLLADGRVVSKAALLDHTYGTGTDVETAVVEVHVSRLRKRLAPLGIAIRVQRGLGYALAEAGR